MATADESKQEELQIQRDDLALRREQFELEKRKGPLNNIAVVITIIASMAAVIFQGGSYLTASQQARAAADNLKAANVQAGRDWSFRGLELFVHEEDKLITCDPSTTNAQVDLFTTLFPEQTLQFRQAASSKSQACVTHLANSAAAAVTAAGSQPSPQLVQEAADHARYTNLAAFAPAISVGDAKNGTAALPTVYLQINTEAQRSAALTLQQALIDQGYHAPGVQLVSSAPRQSQVRFYHPGQEQVAQAAANLIASTLKIPEPSVVAVPGTYKNLPTGIIEFWFPAQENKLD